MKKLYFLLVLLSLLASTEAVAQCSIGNCLSTDCGELNASFMPDGGPVFCDGEVITLNNTSDAGFDYFVVEWGDGTIDTLYDYSDFSHAFVVEEEDLCTNMSTVVYSICFIGYVSCDAGFSCQSGTLAFGIRVRPVASFVLPDLLLVGEAFTLQDFSCNAETYNIDYGDGTTSTDINATHTYETEGSYEIQLEVTNDCGIGVYSLLIEVGELLVNLPPTFVVPSSVNLTCGDSTEPSATGEPTQVEDDTDPNPVVTYIDELVETDCPNRFFIERIWRVTDSEGLFTESSHIISVTDDAPPSFTIPALLEFSNGEDIDDFTLTGMPANLSDNCTAVEDLEIVFGGDVYTTEPGEDCLFSFVRTWQVTDECGNMATKTQQITVSDPFSLDVTITDPPQCPNDLMTTLSLNIMSGAAYTINWNNDDYDGLEVLTNIGIGTYSVTVTNDYGCADSLSRTLTATDTEAPVFQNCPVDTTILLEGNSTATIVSWDLPQAMDNCSATANLELLDNGYPNGMGVFPLGEREIYYLAVDEAGNESDSCRFTVNVSTFDELTIYFDDNDWELLGNRLRMPVKVTDFNNILAYQMTIQLAPETAVDSMVITTLGDQEEINWEAYTNEYTGLLWLSDTGEARSLPDSSTLFYVDVYVNANLTDCLVFNWTEGFVPSVIVRSDGTETTPNLLLGEFCGTPNLAVAGRVTSQTLEPLANIVVALADESILTDFEGHYRFEEVAWGSDGLIVPSYNENPLNGVNVVDFVLIRNHLLRTQVFTNPYAFIAGDTNGSRIISTLDLIAIRRLLLGQNDDFPALPSWQFIPDELTLLLGENIDSVPDYTTAITFEMLDQELLAQDFTGVKTGDVNASAGTTSFSDEHNSLLVTMHTEVLPADNTYLLHFVQNDQEAVAAYQFSLKIENPLVWKLQREEVKLPADCAYNYDTRTGELRIFYGRKQVDHLPAAWPQFTFQSLEDSQREKSQLKVAVTSVIPALMADEEARLKPVVFFDKFSSEISTSIVSSAATTFNVDFSPNPFNSNLIANTWLAEASLVQLTVYGSEGQQLFKTSQPLPSGSFSWPLPDMANLPIGIYFIQLTGASFNTTHKIIKQ